MGEVEKSSSQTTEVCLVEMKSGPVHLQCPTNPFTPFLVMSLAPYKLVCSTAAQSPSILRCAVIRSTM